MDTLRTFKGGSVAFTTHSHITAEVRFWFRHSLGPWVTDWNKLLCADKRRVQTVNLLKCGYDVALPGPFTSKNKWIPRRQTRYKQVQKRWKSVFILSEQCFGMLPVWFPLWNNKVRRSEDGKMALPPATLLLLMFNHHWANYQDC